MMWSMNPVLSDINDNIAPVRPARRIRGIHRPSSLVDRRNGDLQTRCFKLKRLKYLCVARLSQQAIVRHAFLADGEKGSETIQVLNRNRLQ
jgi:hypothetical protein